MSEFDNKPKLNIVPKREVNPAAPVTPFEEQVVGRLVGSMGAKEFEEGLYYRFLDPFDYKKDEFDPVNVALSRPPVRELFFAEIAGVLAMVDLGIEENFLDLPEDARRIVQGRADKNYQALVETQKERDEINKILDRQRMRQNFTVQE